MFNVDGVILCKMDLRAVRYELEIYINSGCSSKRKKQSKEYFMYLFII